MLLRTRESIALAADRSPKVDSGIWPQVAHDRCPVSADGLDVRTVEAAPLSFTRPSNAAAPPSRAAELAAALEEPALSDEEAVRISNGLSSNSICTGCTGQDECYHGICGADR